MVVVGILYLVFLVILLAYPIVGFIQVLNSIQRYTDPGEHPQFYDDIVSYWVLLLTYFIIGAILWSPFMTPYVSKDIYSIYLFGLSFPIMLYNFAIMKKDYRDKSGKLNLN